MMRALSLALAIFLGGTASAHAYSEVNSRVVQEGSGTACLTGGAFAGAAALLFGPGASLGSALLGVPPASAGISAMLGCGASAAAALVYYGARWSYDTFIAETPFPLLYPLPDEIDPKGPVAADEKSHESRASQ